MKKTENNAQSIMNIIRTGETTMRSKRFFLVRALSSIVGIIIALAGSLFIISLIIFTLQKTGSWEAGSFGGEGVVALAAVLPWVLIVAALIFVLIIEVLIQKYAFSYRRPMLYSVAFIVGISLVAGYTVAQTPLHETFEKRGQKIPIMRSLYEHASQHERIHNLHLGRVQNITTSGFTMSADTNEELHVTVSQRTKTPRDFQPKPDMFVSVFGERHENIINARGVRPMHARVKQHIKTNLKSKMPRVEKPSRGATSQIKSETQLRITEQATPEIEILNETNIKFDEKTNVREQQDVSSIDRLINTIAPLK